MGIESGPGGGYSLTRKPEGPGGINIEAGPRPLFQEIEPEDAITVPLFNIYWKDHGIGLMFKQLPIQYQMPHRFGIKVMVNLYEGVIAMQQGKDIHTEYLSTLLGEDKPCYFTGTTNGFYAHDPASNNRNDDFFVAGIAPSQLQDDIKDIGAVWHELGHVYIYQENLDLQLLSAAMSENENLLPKVLQAKDYARNVRTALPHYLLNQKEPITRQTLFDIRKRADSVDKYIRLFHERNAWAAGANLTRIHDLPTGFFPEYDNALERKNHPVLEFFNNARACLATYDRTYYTKQFTRGFKRR